MCACCVHVWGGPFVFLSPLQHLTLVESAETGRASCNMSADPVVSGSMPLQSIVINMVGLNSLPEVKVNTTADGCHGKFNEDPGYPAPIVSSYQYVRIDDEEATLEPFNYVELVVELSKEDSADSIEAFPSWHNAPRELRAIRNSSTDTSITLVLTFEAANETTIRTSLQNIFFDNANRNLNIDARTINITVTDKDGGSGSASLTFCICPYNDAPSITFVSSRQ